MGRVDDQTLIYVKKGTELLKVPPPTHTMLQYC